MVIVSSAIAGQGFCQCFHRERDTGATAEVNAGIVICCSARNVTDRVADRGQRFQIGAMGAVGRCRKGRQYFARSK